VEYFLGRCVLAGGLFIVVSGCAFSKLGQDLDKLAAVAHSFSGTVSTNGRETEAIVVVALDNSDGEGIKTFRMMSTEGPFEIRSDIAPTFFFGFEDINKDLRFQTNEPYGWASDGEAIDPANGSTESIEITIVADSAQPAYPPQLVDEPLADHMRSALQFNSGTVSSLDNPLFSRDQAGKGLWKPYAFMEDGGTGIHFLEPYNSNKIPVLFVHGINATPQDFTTVIERLDTSEYQAWIFSYPSGLRLNWVAQGLYQFMELLHRRHQFTDLHLVAHSMGGLASRGAVNICAKNRSCEYLRSYTSISTPWNGVASVKGGLEWAPTVIPVWRDLDPDGEYVTTIFDTPLPEGLPFHLMFGFKSVVRSFQPGCTSRNEC
jgi:hypothetical protein